MKPAVFLVISLLALACKPEWPREESPTGKPTTVSECDVPAGRFVVSTDSIGPFAVSGTTMDDIVTSCGSVTTEWESTCCYMAVQARADYPGVHLSGEQETQDSVARPLSRVVKWEVSGDSVYLARYGLMPATVADLARTVGPGWAENPTRDDHDGPMAIMCALPTMAFRIRVPSSMKTERWRVDTSAENRAMRVIGLVVVPGREQRNCALVADSLGPPG